MSNGILVQKNILVLILIHGNLKYACKDCGGSQLCLHNQPKYKCKSCKGSSISEHDRQKYACKDCVGKGICIHNTAVDKNTIAKIVVEKEYVFINGKNTNVKIVVEDVEEECAFIKR